MKIGIIREGKVPPDSRVPLVPRQCRVLREQGIDIVVQTSPVRCFSDDAYRAEDVPVVESVEDCDVLLGVKEVPIADLISGKTYFFFSHTIKKQPYNRDLLRSILKQRIRLIDYEVLTNVNGARLIAFGKFAGMVGAHNAMWTYAQRTGKFQLPRMKDVHDYAEAQQIYRDTDFPACRVVLTGTGRVAGGSAQVLDDMGFHKVEPGVFLQVSSDRPVYTQLGVCDYARKKDGSECTEQEYFQHPDRFEIAFARFAESAEIMINGIYWDPAAPAFFAVEEMRSSHFAIQVIADVTCDIAPESSIPSTLRASTIAEPVYGFNTRTEEETTPHQDAVVDVMAVDNLPNELPRDASTAFGEQFIMHIFPELFAKEQSDILKRATIAQAGNLGADFVYLEDYVTD